MSSTYKMSKMSLNMDKSSEKAKKCTFDGCNSDILKNIIVYFGDEKFCDVTLVSGNEDIKIKAHRVVLAASSEYFQAMFGGSLKEAEAAEVKFDEVDGQTLKTVISSIYYSSVELQTCTVENILKAAHLFQLKRLEVTCCDYITNQLDTSNCLGIALFAEQYNYKELYESSYAFTLKYFMEVCKNKEFLLLNADQLNKLLSSDELCVPSEEEVFHTLMLWVGFDRVNREDCIVELIQRVRLTLLQPKFIEDTVEKACKLKKWEKMIYLSYKWHLLPRFEHSYLPEEQTRLRSLKDVVIAISGWGNTALTVALYYSGFDDWIYRWWPCMPEYRVDFGSTIVDDKLIIAGGELSSGESSNRVDCLDLSTLKWTQLPPMTRKRHSCGMVTLDGKVYVIGGFDGGSSLTSMEKWDPLKSQWTMMNMNFYPGRCVGVKGNFLYVVEIYKQHACTYDPLRDAWHSAIAVANDLVGIATVSINEVDHFIMVSKNKINSTNLKYNTVTDSKMDLEFATNCALVGNRLIIYGGGVFKEYSNSGTLKTMPNLKVEGGGFILLSS